eukprot:CAMPEP_0183552636 /NCGR_PEP_ID=MMETSP0371-20130417/71190_1 /TAXON_ID=268820 /ORGANISM="Peridinium aciculiferum, Strain PAER-2" /LENGTH=68 /DNA_ID=CAMNT_0025757683 /DNA_START=223 /DNA_END=426 /DNA_ORIENTATION=-
MAHPLSGTPLNNSEVKQSSTVELNKTRGACKQDMGAVRGEKSSENHAQACLHAARGSKITRRTLGDKA